jgi:hypothetical protein
MIDGLPTGKVIDDTGGGKELENHLKSLEFLIA